MNSLLTLFYPSCLLPYNVHRMHSPWALFLLVTTFTITMGHLRWEWTTVASACKPRHRQYSRLGVWNVRGLGPGNDKLEALVDEMSKRGLDVLFLTEVWRIGNGLQDLEGGSLFIYSGHVTPHHGVGVILNPRLTRAWRASGGIWQPLSERLMTIRIPTGSGRMWQNRVTFNYLSIIVAYSPTEPPRGDGAALAGEGQCLLQGGPSLMCYHTHQGLLLGGG